MFATAATHYPVSPERLPPLDRTAGSYRLRFGRTPADLERVQRLRFEVFNRELGEGLEANWATGLDADPWDELFHHIVIEHVSSGAVVGSYRLQTGTMAEGYAGFYAEAEFDLCRLPRTMLRDAVEIGRACVAAEHRNGRVINLLWRGIAAYLLWNGHRYLFGCCSLPTRDAVTGMSVWQQLKREGFVSRDYSVAPQSGMSCDIPGWPRRPPGRNELPPLFQSYLKLGAEVCGPPAIDAAFGTIDFLVLLDLERLAPRTRTMFFRDLPVPALPQSA
ncbi:GNAT family N-acyltransferase [Wenzhouxiangella sp. XN24]|uniref:GNAT family N-acetyltransferase n=1 Tax=Wenzhouxiangella sp. XN24 TaxID=2713569 RepID=UPI0013EC5D2A|nr:GNAT family N-acyltransferase [Wenzhouxiangella sp. XN24]NGX17044.1 GNAT family N-acetyltransferase [Wenzhouxiangella sp. XN24]